MIDHDRMNKEVSFWTDLLEVCGKHGVVLSYEDYEGHSFHMGEAFLEMPEYDGDGMKYYPTITDYAALRSLGDRVFSSQVEKIVRPYQPGVIRSYATDPHYAIAYSTATQQYFIEATAHSKDLKELVTKSIGITEEDLQ